MLRDLGQAACNFLCRGFHVNYVEDVENILNLVNSNCSKKEQWVSTLEPSWLNGRRSSEEAIITAILRQGRNLLLLAYLHEGALLYVAAKLIFDFMP